MAVIDTFRRAMMRRFTAVDLVTLLYVAFAPAAVLAFSGADHAGGYWLLTAHALIVVLVPVAPAARRAGAVGRFIGDGDAMLLRGGLYAEVGVVSEDLGFQCDRVTQRLGQCVSASQLSSRWTRAMPWPILSWVLHSCYL